jgi:hypothetical protein
LRSGCYFVKLHQYMCFCLAAVLLPGTYRTVGF